MKQAFALSFAGACALVASCSPPDSEFFYEERFETLCDGSPCGWLVGAGPVGSVLWVETLPGEHGVALYGDRVAILGPTEGEEAMEGLDPDSITAFLAARCDEGANLDIDVSVADLTTGTISSFRGTVTPSSAWTDGLSTTPLLRLGGGAPLGAFFVDVVAIRILKNGPGVCEIDELGLTAVDALGF